MELPRLRPVILNILIIGHKFEPESMVPVADSRPIKVKFASSLSDQMKWKFSPGIYNH